MDLQLDNRVSIPLSTLIHELAASYPKIAGYPLYFGVTEDQTPNDRLKQDLAKKGSRYTNWANTNKGYIDWAPYHIPDCASLLSSGLRIDNNASGDEVWCITIPGPFTLNHAVGGFFPQFVPSAPVSAILSNLRPSLRSIFGTNVDEESTALVTAFLIDQRKYLRDHIVSDTISRESFSSVVRNGPAVFRRCKGGIPGIRILEIITLEGLVGRRGDEVVGGLWDVNTGPALKVFRHIMAMIEPLIPADGDLTSDVIARYIGPTLDLWPLTPKPHSFWHHCLWLSRTMIATGVIITSSWSEVVNAAIGGGYLGLVWRSIPDELRTEVLAGNTPLELEDFLPPLSARFWTPRPPTIHEYIRRLGCLFIVQHGPSPFHIHLNVPCLHAGGIKHDAAQAYCMFTIIMHSESVYRVALAEVKLMEEEGLVLRRSSSEETWAYFLKLKARAEAKIVASGLRQQLESQKDQYLILSWSQAHLRSKQVTQVPRAPKSSDYRIPGVTHTLGRPFSEERLSQFQTLAADHKTRQRGGNNADPFHLVPFQFRDAPYGEAMRVWFGGREEDIRISNSTRTTGKTQLAYDNAMASRKALNDNKPALSLGGTKGTATARRNREAAEDPKTLLIQCLEELAKWHVYTRGLSELTGSRWSDGWRWGHCPLCGALIISRDRNTKHSCNPGDPASVIQDKDHKSLQVLNNLHDVLRIPELAALVEGCIDHLHLIKLCTFDILQRPENKKIREKQLPGIDMEATKSIFVWKTNSERDDAWWEVTLAVDACLELVSTCPRHLWPTDAANRGRAWAHEGMVTKWEPGQERHFVRCFEGYNAVLQPYPRAGGRPSVFIHVCNYTRRAAVARGKRPEAAHLESKAEGGPQDCSADHARPMQKHEIRSRVDLPPDHLRSRWYFERVFPKLDWVAGAKAKASSSKSKKGKNKGKKK